MPRPLLSIVVVLYEMRREAERTLHSLSSAYQKDVSHRDYEVQVVENGSKRAVVDEEFVRSFGPNFHYHYLESAPPSPARALNYGVAKSRGEHVALMIDGAHILTPRVMAYALQAVQVFPCPVVAVRRLYLGPGQQPETILDGYCQEIEDDLLAQIRWPQDPYRLFEIGVSMSEARFVWFGRLYESNCLIMPRRVYRAIGGSDERFDLPGGGFLNLDLYSRSLAYPGAQLVVLLGEGSFHQVHGGMTTNAAPDEVEKRVQLYRDQYRQVRGKDYVPPNVAAEFLGTLHPQSLLV